MLGCTLYQLFAADLSYNENTVNATFNDDTAIVSSYNKLTVASANVKTNKDALKVWTMHGE